MMRRRLIPTLLLDRDRRLVKTVGFGKRTYIGDPFNVVRLFNEKEVDEICILDIDATVDNRSADAGFIAELAAECFMPLAYGGGLGRQAPIDLLARNGVEKFVIGSRIDDPDFIRGLAADFGTQAVVGCVDYAGGKAVTHGGRRATAFTPLEAAQKFIDSGAGEIILQSVEHDGRRTGMDLATITTVSRDARVPVVALGGAGSVNHLTDALDAGASAAASGSAFSFVGRLRAVLISYPVPQDLN